MTVSRVARPEAPPCGPLGRTGSVRAAGRVRRGGHSVPAEVVARLAGPAGGGRSRSFLISLVAAALVFLAVLATTPRGVAGASVRPAAHDSTARTSAVQGEAEGDGAAGGTLGAAAATGGSGCDVVHIGPYVPPGSPASSYFDLTLSRGAAASEALVVANPQPYPCQVRLLPAYGSTAVNGGDSYVPVEGSRCVAASCWLGGLPETVTVPAHGRENVSFPISVPAAARSGQYLAGVIGQPASPPKPARVRAGSSQQGVVSATVVARVAIGVAITIPGKLSPGLRVPDVLLSRTTVPPSLEVVVANDGNTWIHPAGRLVVELKPRSATVPLRSATVLPGGHASLAVPVGRLTPGPHEVLVDIPYGRGLVARWRGTIDFPATSAVAPARPGTTTITVTESKVPPWALALIAVLLVALLALAGVIVAVALRRRRVAPHPPEPGGAPSPSEA
jgi:hypothetical protein